MDNKLNKNKKKSSVLDPNNKERTTSYRKSRRLARGSVRFPTNDNNFEAVSAVKKDKWSSLTSKKAITSTITRSTTTASAASKPQSSVVEKKKVFKLTTRSRSDGQIIANAEKVFNLNSQSRVSEPLLNGQAFSDMRTSLQAPILKKISHDGSIVKTKMKATIVAQVKKPIFRLGKITEINEDINTGDVTEEDDDVIMVEINKKSRSQSATISASFSRKRKSEDNSAQEGRNIRPFKGKEKENIPPSRPLNACKITSKKVALVMAISYTENLLADEESKAGELANLVAKRQSSVVTIVNKISQSVGQQEVRTEGKLGDLINALDNANEKLRDGVLRFEAKVRVVNTFRASLARKRAQLSRLNVSHSTEFLRGTRS